MYNCLYTVYKCIIYTYNCLSIVYSFIIIRKKRKKFFIFRKRFFESKSIGCGTSNNNEKSYRLNVELTHYRDFY